MADISSINSVVITAKDDTGTAINSAIGGFKSFGTQIDAIMNRTDPLGAKLRSLQSDFAALNNAAKSGLLAGSESTVDAAYARLNTQIAQLQGAMGQAGAAGRSGFEAITAAGEDTIAMTTRSKTEFIVLAHEILTGRFSRIPGSLLVMSMGIRGGIAAMADFLVPIAAVGAAIGLMILGFEKGRAETDAMDQAIFKSGNTAGVTRGQMLELADSVAHTGDISVSASKSLVEALVASGKLGNESLQAVALLAADYAQQTGDDIKKVGAELLKVFDDPTAGAHKLNETMGFLSIADMAYIKELQEMGQSEEARLLLADKLRDKLDATDGQLGTLQKSWGAIKTIAMAAWDAMLNIGRLEGVKSLEQQVKDQEQALADLKAGMGRLDFSTLGGSIGGIGTPSPLAVAQAQALLDATRQRLAASQADAEIEANVTNQNKLQQGLMDDINKSHTSQAHSLDLELANLKANHDAMKAQFSDQKAAAAFELDYQTRISEIVKQRDNLLKQSGPKAVDDRSAQLALDLAHEQSALADEKTVFDERDKMLVLYHSKLGMDDDTFNAGRKAARDQYIAAEQTAYDAEISSLVNYVGKNSKEYDDIQKKESDVEAKHAKFVSDMNAQQLGDDLTSLVAEQKAYDGIIASIDKTGDADLKRLNASIAAQKLHNDEIGKTREQIDLVKAATEAAATAQLQGEADAIAALLQEQGLDVNAVRIYTDMLAELNLIIAARQKDAKLRTDGAALDAAAADAKIYASEWKKALDSVDKGLTGFFDDLLTNGSSAFRNLWDNFKKWALEALAEIAAKQVIVSIVGMTGIGGSVAVNAANLLGNNNGLGSISNLLTGAGGNPLSNLFGTGNLFNSFATSGVGEALGLSAPIASVPGGLSLGVEEMAGSATLASTGLTAFGTALSAALPIIGIATAALALFGSGLFGHRGGPKVGGTASDITGVPGMNFYPGETGSAGNVSTRTLLDTTTQSYQQTLAALGGTGSAQFALGFDTDPQGSAGNRASGAATVNGRPVFKQLDVGAGNDSAGLQTALSLEAQRAVLAALQASSLTAYLANLLKGLDATTASAADITGLITTAQAAKQLVDAFDKVLKPDQVQTFTDALNKIDFTAPTGALKAIADAAFSVLDPAMKPVIDAFTGTDAAFATFAATLLAISADTGKFSDSFRATIVTALGDGTQATADKVLGFVTILNDFGATLPDVTAHLETLSATDIPTFIDALGGASAALNAFNYINQNFLTSAQRTAAATTTLNADFAALGVAVPQTHADFLAFLNTITDPKQYAYALTVLAPLFIAVHGTADQAASSLTNLNTTLAATAAAANQITVSVGSIISEAEGMANKLLGQFSTLAGQSTGTFGDKLSIQIGLIQDAIKNASPDQFTSSIAFNAYVATLQKSNATFTDQLARFDALSVQYDASRAEQLVNLEDWDTAQKKLFAGMPDDLAAVQTIFQQKWDAIVNGTQAGISGAQSALDQIAKYLQGLFVGPLSPLTPLQQLAQAKSNYDAQLTLAQGGNATALGSITQYADTFLKLEQGAYASSQTYTDAFNQVTQQLGALAGTQPNGQPLPTHVDTNVAIAAALPSGSKLASSADIKTVNTTMTDLIAALASSNTRDATTAARAMITAYEKAQTAARTATLK